MAVLDKGIWHPDKEEYKLSAMDNFQTPGNSDTTKIDSDGISCTSKPAACNIPLAGENNE